jgi:hypothetical protein
MIDDDHFKKWLDDKIEREGVSPGIAAALLGDVPVLDSLHTKFGELLAAMAVCFRLKLTTPTLILLYTGMDVGAWLASTNPGAKTKQRFLPWVKKYVLTHPSLDCSAIDLYAARCGVLHNLSPESDLSRGGKARQILYAWGDSEAADLRKMIERGEMQNIVAVQLESLIEHFRAGIKRFLDDARSSPAVSKELQKKNLKVFRSMSKEEATLLSRWTDELLG